MNRLTSACVAFAFASTSGLAFGSTITVSPGNPITRTNSYTNTSANTVVPGNATINDVTANPAGGYTYSNGFGAPQTPITGTSGTYSFYDDYVFSILGSQADSITSTINLASGGFNIDLKNLDVQLFNFSNSNTLPYLSGNGMGDADGVTSVKISAGGTGTTEVLRTTSPLNAGTYVLQVRGLVDGSNGGTYTGSLNIAPVPLPAAGLLLLSGLAGLGFMGRRRRESVAV